MKVLKLFKIFECLRKGPSCFVKHVCAPFEKIIYMQSIFFTQNGVQEKKARSEILSHPLLF